MDRKQFVFEGSVNRASHPGIVSWGTEIRLRCYGTASSNEPIAVSRLVDEWIWSFGGMAIGRGKPK